MERTFENMKIVGCLPLQETGPLISHKLAADQIPVMVDEDRAFVMRIPKVCSVCPSQPDQAFLDHWKGDYFARRFTMLRRAEKLGPALKIPSEVILSRLAQSVECVGCRRSVENMFYYIQKSQNNFLEPMKISTSGTLSIPWTNSLRPNRVSHMFVKHSLSIDQVMKGFVKKNRKCGRCTLHSMDGLKHKQKQPTWLAMWNGLAGKHKKMLTLVDCTELYNTLNEYLDKYRFCFDCKHKVHKAYNILVGLETMDTIKDKTFVASLYQHIEKCDSTHIHVPTDSNYLLTLIEKSKPDLHGRRERHAKTLEVAQEEVLTCLGLFLHDRIHGLAMRMKEEEQSYQIILHLGVDCLRRSMQTAYENLRGYTNLDNICEELSKQETCKQEKNKKNNKKQNRTNKNKNTCKKTSTNPKYMCEEQDEDGEQSSWISDDDDSAEFTHGVTTQNSFQGLCDSECVGKHKRATKIGPWASERPLKSRCEAFDVGGRSAFASDGGYYSTECSSGSSRESSDVACDEGFCSHADDDALEPFFKTSKSYRPLSQLLQESAEKQDEGLDEMEVEEWQRKNGDVTVERQTLRQELKLKFQQFIRTRNAN